MTTDKKLDSEELVIPIALQSAFQPTELKNTGTKNKKKGIKNLQLISCEPITDREQKFLLKCKKNPFNVYINTLDTNYIT